MTAAPPAEKRFTVTGHHGLGESFLNGERTELIRGRILKKTASSPGHNYLVDSPEELGREVLTPNLLVRRERGLTLDDSEPEPDIAVVTGHHRAEYRHHHPATALLAMEISMTPEERDREKIAIYAEANVQAYWIVLPGRNRVEVYREPQGGRYRRTAVHRAGETIVSEGLPNLRVEVGALLAGSADE